MTPFLLSLLCYESVINVNNDVSVFWRATWSLTSVWIRVRANCPREQFTRIIRVSVKRPLGIGFRIGIGLGIYRHSSKSSVYRRWYLQGMLKSVFFQKSIIVSLKSIFYRLSWRHYCSSTNAVLHVMSGRRVTGALRLKLIVMLLCRWACIPVVCPPGDASSLLQRLQRTFAAPTLVKLLQSPYVRFVHAIRRRHY